MKIEKTPDSDSHIGVTIIVTSLTKKYHLISRKLQSV